MIRNLEKYATIASIMKLTSQGEPYRWGKAREQISVWCSNYGGGYLEWYPFKQVIGDTDQLTISYLCIFPGRGQAGDIEGFAQLYNPEHTWGNQQFDELICEYARFGWSDQTIYGGSHRFYMPSVNNDNIVALGYVTFRVKF